MGGQTRYKIIRVWGFGDVTEKPKSSVTDPNKVWYQLHNKTGGFINYGKDGIQRLDYVVSTAEKLGLKLVLPFVNNWPDLGGMSVYSSMYGSKSNFYQNTKSQEVYKDYIKVLVTRYRNSSAIFSWQLCNEPRCPGCETSVITKWAGDISKYIKSLDPHHMVTMGDEGWLGETSGYVDMDGTKTLAYMSHDGVDFYANLNISTLDYGVFHLYPNLWGYSYNWGNHWIRQHSDIGLKVRVHRTAEQQATALQSYIVKGKYTKQQFVDAGTLTALDGTKLTVTTTDNAIFVNGIQVIDVNISATNGVIHMLNGLWSSAQ